MQYSESPLIANARYHEISLEGSLEQLVVLPASQLSPLDRLIVAQEIELLQNSFERADGHVPPKSFDKDARLDRSAIWMQKASPLVQGLRENGVVTYGQLHDRLHRLAPSHGLNGSLLNEKFEDLLKGKFYESKAGDNCYENTGRVTQPFRLACKVGDVSVEQALIKPATHEIAARVGTSASPLQQP